MNWGFYLNLEFSSLISYDFVVFMIRLMVVVFASSTLNKNANRPLTFY